MEIATEIIKIRETYNSKNRIRRFISLVKECKLTELSVEDMKNVDSQKIQKIDVMFNKLFITKRKIGEALVFAYLIVSCTDQLFSTYKTTLENRLIKAAFNLVYKIEHSKDFTQFIDLFDHYNCLYNLWTKNSVVETIDNVMQTVVELTLFNNKYVDKINDMLDDVISVDKMLGLKIIFVNYWKLCSVPAVLNKVWQIVEDQLKTDFEQTVLILLAELRIRIINVCNSPLYKKKLYYKVDLEDVVRKIRSNKLDVNCFNSMFELFCKSLNVNIIKLTNVDGDIIRCFKELYSTCAINFV